MGRYRRGHKHQQKWRGGGRKQKRGEHGGDDGDGDSTFQMNESDWSMVEGYLLEYRTRAHEAYCSRRGGEQSSSSSSDDDDPPAVIIGNHHFPPLTTSTCSRPYIDLPATLNHNERRKVHELCSYLDLYHAGAGGRDVVGGADDDGNNIDPTEDDDDNNNGEGRSRADPAMLDRRRIAVSIFVDGLEYVPDVGGVRDYRSSFPSRTCRPWFHRACVNSTLSDGGSNGNENDDDDPFVGRKRAIEMEKRLIRQFMNLPEQSVRGLDDGDQFCDSLDFGVLDTLDLAMIPSPADTPWMLVDTVEKLIQCANELVYGTADDGNNGNGPRSSKIHELAFDLEMHNIGEGKSGIRTCLMQLTSDVVTTIVDDQGADTKRVYKDYIVDPLAPGVWDAIPTHLGPIFSDPNIVKIGHGIGGMDVSSLHRDFGILVVNAFDTYEASTVLGQSRKGMGLLSLCRHYGLPNWEHYQTLKGKYQKSDWQRRPLTSSALEYGRFDIRYLVALRKLLMRDLTKMDMLVGPLQTGSSSDEDIGIEVASTHMSNDEASSVNSHDLRIESRITDATSSFSEDNEFTNSSSHQEQCECVDEDIIPNALSLPPSSFIPIIHASEFPCYHHLMKAISLSQKRCLMLWSGDEVESVARNHSLLSIIKQGVNQRGYGKYWSDVHMQLYGKLVEWRLDAARRESNTVDAICSLDFLVFVAYKLPTSRSAMRRYSYALPATLQDDTAPYCYELCELVTSSDAFNRQQNQHLSEVKSIDVIYYSDNSDNEKVHDRRTLFRVLVVSAVCGAFVIAMTRARRR